MEELLFSKEFNETIFDHLMTYVESYEDLKMDEGRFAEYFGCSFYTSTGIRELSIRPNTHIIPYYVEDKYIDLEMFVKIPENYRVLIVTNLPKNEIKNVKMTENIKIISATDIRFSHKRGKEFEPLENKILYHSDNQRRIRKTKCISIDRFDALITFAIQRRIVEELFKKDNRDNFIIEQGNIICNINQTNPLPFAFQHSNRWYYFFENKTDILKLKNDEERRKYIFVKLDFPFDKYYEKEKSFLEIRVRYYEEYLFEKIETYQELPGSIILRKINKNDLLKCIKSFNALYGEYETDDYTPLFKYRKFEKTRYESEERVTVDPVGLYVESGEIEIGNRSALENKMIWFSNNESLNDPFDLVLRKPTNLRISKYLDFEKTIEAINYSVQNSSALTFCTTSKSDNILMWSHYGDSHKGTCMSYPMREILNAVENDPECSLCIYGKIRYDIVRPTFFMAYVRFRFIDFELAILRFNIASMFNKYKKWIYEDEYRFIIFPEHEEWPGAQKGHGVKLEGKQLFIGNKFPSTYINYINNFYPKYKKYALSDSSYELK